MIGDLLTPPFLTHVVVGEPREPMTEVELLAGLRVEIAAEFVLLCALRRIGLHETEYAKATCGIIRLELSR